MTAHPIDIHIGQKLKSRRITIGMSQEDLGNAIGVTFQQIQKYERGINKMSLSRLFDIASILNTPIIFFLEGIGKRGRPALAEDKIDLLLDKNKCDNKEVLSLVRAYSNISDEKTRRHILALVKGLSGN
ncbi:Helix-turn-helix domain protein [Rickettsiales bacterium Ac37b]|nr:Helix-turn-helix domain protein [Rickettsiales bacterium Ac37b]